MTDSEIRTSIFTFEQRRLLFVDDLIQARLTQVLNAIGSAVLLVDRLGHIVFINGAAERLLGVKALEITGSPAEKVPAPWTEHLGMMPGEEIRGWMDALGEDGNCRWVDWQICPVKDTDGFTGWLVMAEDRTDHYRWLQADRQAERMALTVTMVGALAHELRNPLSAAAGVLQLMSRKREPEKIVSYANLVMTELDRVTRLLNELLLLGRPADFSPEPIDLVDFVHKLMPLLEGETVGTGVQLKTNLSAVPPVLGDQGQLTQVLLNLIRNAVQACGDTGKVVIGISRKGAYIELEICDTGPGLKPEVMEKLFGPFFTTKESGTGLGLPICQAIIHNHGGRVSAANACDGGAVFTVKIPAQRLQDNKHGIDVMVMIADDTARYSVENILRAHGFTTVSAAGMENALALAGIYTPDVLLADQDILTLNQRERLEDVWPGLKILVVADSHGRTSTEDYYFIQRPLEYARLVEQVKFLIYNTGEEK